jgi:hypothetical protein
MGIAARDEPPVEVALMHMNVVDDALWSAPAADYAAGHRVPYRMMAAPASETIAPTTSLARGVVRSTTAIQTSELTM